MWCVKSSILSWDRLRPTHTSRATTTAFLSEQDDSVLASARYRYELVAYTLRFILG